MNVVLIGFRCAGKSTVGKMLAGRLGRPFLDCDEYIEQKTHLTIREIFDLAGESYFRTLEGQAIADLSRLDGQVLATGGGAILKRQNTKYLKRNGVFVLLDVTPDTAFRRIVADPTSKTRRPALTDFDPLTEIQEQMALRQPYYLEAADCVVKSDRRPVEDVVKEILVFLERRGLVPPPGKGPDDHNDLVPLA
jgi:shikimate kinase